MFVNDHAFSDVIFVGEKGEIKMNSRIMGYARVSSKSQNLDRQIVQLEKYVQRENIIIDKASGENLNREGYQALKGPLGLREGDTLVIVSLDRLSRNKNDIKNELEWFREHKVILMVLDIPTTLISVPEGQEWIREMINNIIIEVISSIAEQERITIRQRQREGIEAARAKGKHLGRPKLSKPPEWDRYYLLWKDGEITAVEAMKILGLKKSSFYKFVKQENG